MVVVVVVVIVVCAYLTFFSSVFIFPHPSHTLAIVTLLENSLMSSSYEFLHLVKFHSQVIAVEGNNGFWCNVI